MMFAPLSLGNSGFHKSSEVTSWMKARGQTTAHQGRSAMTSLKDHNSCFLSRPVALLLSYRRQFALYHLVHDLCPHGSRFFKHKAV